MGRRRFPVASWPPRSLCPWWLPDSDLVPANLGKLEFTRDLVLRGVAQKQIALFVTGQYVPSLGLMAIRCERRMGATGEELIPIGMALPDDEPFMPMRL